VGIALYDPAVKVAGLAHIMLPDSTKLNNNKNPAKFADTGMAKLIQDMVNIGASKTRLLAKIAGGAQMFAFNAKNDEMRIGDRNVEATLKLLKKFAIPLIAYEVGANYGRTVELYAEDGRFLIKTIGHGNRVL
jgi:chemotaxis protein CheD